MAKFLDKMYNQNPWWIDIESLRHDYHIEELAKNKFIFRKQEFLNYKFGDGVYIVTGPRQIGKTTHLKLLIQEKITDANKENFLYFNCDFLDSKQDIVEVVEEYLANFSSTGRKFIFLDEITAVKDGILAIKYLVDAGKKHSITYILTGSSMVNIKKTGEFLPGRRGQGKDFVFHPISFRQFLSIQYPDADITRSKNERFEKFYNRIKQDVPLAANFEKFLISGGIPKVVNNYLEDKEFNQENFQLYRDWLVSEIAKNGKREQIVKLLLQRIMISLGSDVSYNSFAVDAGIGSHNTVYEYLNFLEDTFVIRQIYHYDYHQKKVNIRKNKKIYFTDTFLFWLSDWWLNGNSTTYQTVNRNYILKSRIVENVAFIHLQSLFTDLFFYREDQEIDFVSKQVAIECKYRDSIALDDIKALLKFIGKRVIITKNNCETKKEYIMLPIELFLLLDKESLVGG